MRPHSQADSEAHPRRRARRSPNCRRDGRRYINNFLPPIQLFTGDDTSEILVRKNVNPLFGANQICLPVVALPKIGNRNSRNSRISQIFLTKI
jgi:hypothetical protein